MSRSSKIMAEVDFAYISGWPFHVVERDFRKANKQMIKIGDVPGDIPHGEKLNCC
jgi:hypothetical protein